MVEKLENKLLKVTTISLTLVLSVVIICVAVLSFSHMLRRADDTLTAFSKINMDKEFEYIYPPPPARGRDEFANPIIGPFNFHSVIAIRFDSDENIEFINFSEWDEATKNQIIRSARTLYKQDDERGFINLYRYYKSGESIYFLSIRESFSAFASAIIFMILAALGGIISVLVLVKIFSRRIIKPIIKSYEKQRRFITDAGHEIKTPLAIIGADCEVLELEKGRSEWSDDIKKQIDRLTHLTNDLIFLSKMEEEQESDMIALPFSDIVKDVASSFAALYKSEGKEIVLSIDKDIIEVIGIGSELERLVYILLDNALKYSTKESKIHVDLKENKNYCTLSVQNKTDRKNLENLDCLFDRFYRADSSRSSDKNGFGIGLAIAKAIVENHKGEIEAKEIEIGVMDIIVQLPVKKY